jgi:O-antigen/teichoic acid export membrane protein
MGSFVLGGLASYLVTLFFLKFIINSDKDKNIDNGEVYAVDLKSMKSYIWPVLACNLALTILCNADMVIARHNIDAVSSGQYGALTVVSKVILFVTGVVVPVLFSMSAENHHKKSDSAGLFWQAILIVLGLSLVALGFYFFTPKLVMWVIFGSKYFAVSGYLGWLAVAVVLFSFTNLIAQYLLSLHKTGLSYILLIFSVIFIIVLLFWGKGISAIIGITIAVQLVTLAASLVYLFKNNKKLDYSN